MRWFAERFPHYIDELVEFPGFPGIPERDCRDASLRRFLDRAEAMRFDLVLQAHGDGRLMNIFTALLGGRRTVGFYRPGLFCPDHRAFLPYRSGENEVHRLLRLAERADAPPAGDHLEFPLSPADDDEAERLSWLAELDGTPYACVHPGSKDPTRRWSVEGFAGVARALASQGYQVVLTGGGSERRLANTVMARAGIPCVNGTGTSLGVLAVVLRGARLLVCNDTGVSHLAAALGLPSVVLFTRSEPRCWGPLDWARHVPVRANQRGGDGAVHREIERVVSAVARLPLRHESSGGPRTPSPSSS